MHTCVFLTLRIENIFLSIGLTNIFVHLSAFYTTLKIKLVGHFLQYFGPPSTSDIRCLCTERNVALFEYKMREISKNGVKDVLCTCG
jgi:hypothetical protein